MVPDLTAPELEFEHARLSDLGRYALTFDEPEAPFDSAVKLLCDLCGVPLGGISIVDSDTVWLKARHGVELSRVARSVSFCTLAIKSGRDLFLIPDTAADARFQSHPMVQEPPHVRYYAAAPLFSQAGFAIGTLWVMDFKPNALDRTGEETLRMVASHVATLLDARYLSGDLRLYNQAGFLRQMRDRLTGPDHDRLVVGSVNIRGLRHINDTYGHDAGNLAVEEVARHIQLWADEAIEPLIFSPIVAHLGSGNFALLLAGAATRASIGYLVDSLRRCTIRLGDQRIPVVTTVSLLDCRGAEPASAPALLDRALLIAREAPNSGVCVLHDKGTSFDEPLETLAIEFRAALTGKSSSGHIATYFQPIFDMTEPRMAGFETLLRWEHPTLGSLPPSRFLPLAERTGLSYQLDLYTFESICRVISMWRGLGHAPPKISVNIARTSLLAPDLGKSLVDIAAEHGVSPQDVELEITAAGIVDPKSLIDRVTTLRSAGFTIAINDFGTGSNLDTLHAVPCDALKIGRKFVNGVADTRKTAEFCRLLIGIAGGLGVRLICIGAETEEDSYWLAANGVRLVQGWYFAEAQPEEKAMQLLRLTAPQGRQSSGRNVALLHDWARQTL